MARREGAVVVLRVVVGVALGCVGGGVRERGGGGEGVNGRSLEMDAWRVRWCELAELGGRRTSSRALGSCDAAREPSSLNCFAPLRPPEAAPEPRLKMFRLADPSSPTLVSGIVLAMALIATDIDAN